MSANNVVEMSKYLLNKKSILGAVDEKGLLRQQYAAAQTQEAIRLAYKQAIVLHHKNNYLVVLNLSIWNYLRFFVLCFKTFGEFPSTLLRGKLGRYDSDLKQVVVLRKGPSARKFKNLLRAFGGI